MTLTSSQMGSLLIVEATPVFPETLHMAIRLAPLWAVLYQLLRISPAALTQPLSMNTLTIDPFAVHHYHSNKHIYIYIFPIGYSLLAIPYWLFPIGYSLLIYTMFVSKPTAAHRAHTAYGG